MRIEDVTKENLANLNDGDLWKLRFRCSQLWDKYFHKSSDVVVGALNRTNLLEQYAILSEVLKNRGKKISTTNIDRALYKSKLQKKNEVEHPLKLLVKEDDEDERIVYGIVYEPDETDTQGDTAKAEWIRKACHYFMENSQAVKMNHKGGKISASVLENYITLWEGSIAGRVIKAGTWLLSLRINSPKVWDKIKKGDLTGFSMAGWTEYKPLEDK